MEWSNLQVTRMLIYPYIKLAFNTSTSLLKTVLPVLCSLSACQMLDLVKLHLGGASSRWSGA
jgi:hypothetical protein